MFGNPHLTSAPLSHTAALFASHLYSLFGQNVHNSMFPSECIEIVTKIRTIPHRSTSELDFFQGLL